MKWYRNLYLGEGAKKAKYKIFGRVRKSKFTINTFLITLPSNSSNVLDIISANMMLQKHFKKKMYTDKLYIVGLAKGRDEALEVVRTIVDDVYTRSGGFDVAGTLKFGPGNK